MLDKGVHLKRGRGWSKEGDAKYAARSLVNTEELKNKKYTTAESEGKAIFVHLLEWCWKAFFFFTILRPCQRGGVGWSHRHTLLRSTGGEGPGFDIKTGGWLGRTLLVQQGGGNPPHGFPPWENGEIRGVEKFPPTK